MSDPKSIPSEGLPVPENVAEVTSENANPPPTFREFLETSPPDVSIVVRERVVGPFTGNYDRSIFYKLATPELDLHCENCNGTRSFISQENGAVLSKGLTFDELNYQCKNCKERQKFKKRFCLAIFNQGNTGDVQKIGEYPAYSPVTSRKVYDLVGENHRELFLKGRRAELRGLGIGAFGYYRRIVDDQKDRIIGQLESAAKRLEAPPDVLKIFAHAKTEDQFTNAIKQIKDALPPALFVSGHNPLTVLYDVLSDGIHELSDEECLAHARTVRTLLIALADRIAEISKDEAKVQQAVGEFLNRKRSKESRR
ncbi:MAG: hypothetical protein ABLQ96_02420 [Candidatus Acidiferrum sp.]